MLRGLVHQASDHGACGPWPWTALDRIVGPLWPLDSAGRWGNLLSRSTMGFVSIHAYIVDSVRTCVLWRV